MARFVAAKSYADFCLQKYNEHKTPCCVKPKAAPSPACSAYAAPSGCGQAEALSDIRVVGFPVGTSRLALVSKSLSRFMTSVPIFQEKPCKRSLSRSFLEAVSPLENKQGSNSSAFARMPEPALPPTSRE